MNERIYLSVKELALSPTALRRDTGLKTFIGVYFLLIDFSFINLFFENNY